MYFDTCHYNKIQCNSVLCSSTKAQNAGGQAQIDGGPAQIAGGQAQIAGGQPQIDVKDDNKNIIDVLAPHNIYDHIWLKYLLKPYLA